MNQGGNQRCEATGHIHADPTQRAHQLAQRPVRPVFQKAVGGLLLVIGLVVLFYFLTMARLTGGG